MNYEKEYKKAEEYAERQRIKSEIYEIKHKYDKKKELPTHKLVTLFLFIMLNVVLIYSLIAMWHFADLTHLGLLISDICGQLLTFIIYSHHSTAQNTAGGINFELAMKKQKKEEGETIFDE